jgi:hypothetical protein
MSFFGQILVHNKEEYPVIVNMTIRILLPFSTTYLCEFRSSKLTETKALKGERLRTVVALSSVSLVQRSEPESGTEKN